MDLQEIVNQVIVVVVGLIVAGVSGLVMQWLSNAIKVMKTKVRLEDFQILWNIVNQVVRAAEQMGLNNLVSDKKTWALSEIQKILDGRGLSYISAEEISALIESTVLTEFNKSPLKDDLAELDSSPSDQ